MTVSDNNLCLQDIGTLLYQTRLGEYIPIKGGRVLEFDFSRFCFIDQDNRPMSMYVSPVEVKPLIFHNDFHQNGMDDFVKGVFI